MSNFVDSSQFMYADVNGLVKRKEAIAKLRELKLQFDLKYPEQKQNFSFYRLLSDLAYRECSLLKLSYQEDDYLRECATSLLDMDIKSSLFSGGPNLGEDTLLITYPTNPQSNINAKAFKRVGTCVKFPFYKIEKESVSNAVFNRT